jgi:hypothetical protein
MERERVVCVVCGYVWRVCVGVWVWGMWVCVCENVILQEVLSLLNSNTKEIKPYTVCETAYP